MKNWLGILLTLIFPLFANQLEMERGDGSKLVFYVDTPISESFPITLIIPGSQKEAVQVTHHALKELILEGRRCPLSIEKRGVQGNSIDEKEFQQFLSLDNRKEDILQVLKSLKKHLPSWNGKIAILGQGDGGRIGAQIATQIENVEALILISSGGAWPPLEEALYSFRSEMADEGYSPQYIHGFMVQARQQFNQALKTPKSDLKAFGFSYKYWESLLKTNLLQDLLLLSCPIYSVNSMQDERVPIESVDALAKLLPNKLTLQRINSLRKEIIQNQKTYSDAISWLDGLN
jgi:hypothetical protein